MKCEYSKCVNQAFYKVWMFSSCLFPRYLCIHCLKRMIKDLGRNYKFKPFSVEQIK